MPLKQGYSSKSVGANIRKEIKAGKSKDQAVAIAMNVAERTKKRKKGK